MSITPEERHQWIDDAYYTLETYGDIQSSSVTHAERIIRLLDDLEAAELEGQWRGEVLAEIAGALTTIGCVHGGDHESTPPMMYPEWVACVVASQRQAAEARAVRWKHAAKRARARMGEEDPRD